MPAISTTLRRDALAFAVLVSTTAAAPSVTREQSWSRNGAATIMLEPRPDSGSAMIASAVAGPFCTWASGFLAALR